MVAKAVDAFRTISEVAELLDVPKHVLRFWEGKFPHIKPMKRGGGRRYYRPADVELLQGIRALLHNEGYTIKGVQKILREQGVDAVKGFFGDADQGGVQNSAKTLKSKKRPGKSSTRSTKPAATAKQRAAFPAELNKTSMAAIVQSAIAELESCRALLRPAEPAAATKVRRTPVRVSAA